MNQQKLIGGFVYNKSKGVRSMTKKQLLTTMWGMASSMGIDLDRIVESHISTKQKEEQSEESKEYFLKKAEEKRQRKATKRNKQ